MSGRSAATAEGRQFDAFSHAYARARPAYPASLFAVLRARRASFACAVDIGCGTGQSLIGLQGIARTIIGIDPSAVMIDQARARLPQVRYRIGTGEDTGLADGSADLVTIGTAFHWMDADATAREVSRILRPKGVFAIFRYDIPQLSGRAAAAFRRRLECDWLPFVSPRILGATDAARHLAPPTWRDVVSGILPHAPHYDPDDFVRLMLATSYVRAFLDQHATPHLYEEEFHREFRTLCPGGLPVGLDIKYVVANRDG
jgi:SAM-dependent methyltransferase